MKTLGEQAAEKIGDYIFAHYPVPQVNLTELAQIIDTLPQQPCGCEKLIARWEAEAASGNWDAGYTNTFLRCARELRDALAQPCQPASVGSEEWTAYNKFSIELPNGKVVTCGSTDGRNLLLSAHNAALRRQSTPTPAVAKIAAEIAPDLPDYVESDGNHCYVTYRTADAQEMIERAFAGLEAELEQARKELDENWVTHQRVVQAEARLATAEAELKAYREGGLTEEILRRNDGYIKVGKGCAITLDDNALLRARLATAEAALEERKFGDLAHKLSGDKAKGGAQS